MYSTTLSQRWDVVPAHVTACMYTDKQMRNYMGKWGVLVGCGLISYQGLQRPACTANNISCMYLVNPKDKQNPLAVLEAHAFVLLLLNWFGERQC